MLTPTMSSDNKTTTFVFPHETLTKIVSEQTNTSIHVLKKELYANALANECTLGCGIRGYLGLIMPTTEYCELQKSEAIDDNESDDEDSRDSDSDSDNSKAKSTKTEGKAVKFEKPKPNPEAEPAIFKEEQRKFRDYVAMDTKLCNQLLEAVNKCYLAMTFCTPHVDTGVRQVVDDSTIIVITRIICHFKDQLQALIDWCLHLNIPAIIIPSLETLITIIEASISLTNTNTTTSQQ
jgi:hypothetical protein